MADRGGLQKANALKMIREDGRCVSDVCHALNISESSLLWWLEEADRASPETPGMFKPLIAAHSRITELEKEVGQLKSENLLIRRAAALFARGLD